MKLAFMMLLKTDSSPLFTENIRLKYGIYDEMEIDTTREQQIEQLLDVYF